VHEKCVVKEARGLCGQALDCVFKQT
jgi:hypothetical protein